MKDRETPNWLEEIEALKAQLGQTEKKGPSDSGSMPVEQEAGDRAFSAAEFTTTDMQQRIHSQVVFAIEELIENAPELTRLQALRSVVGKLVERLQHFHPDEQDLVEELALYELMVLLQVSSKDELEELIPPEKLYNRFIRSLQFILEDRKRLGGSSELSIPHELQDDYNRLLDEERSLQTRAPARGVDLTDGQLADFKRLGEVRERLQQLYKEIESIRRSHYLLYPRKND